MDGKVVTMTTSRIVKEGSEDQTRRKKEERQVSKHGRLKKIAQTTAKCEDGSVDGMGEGSNCDDTEHLHVRLISCFGGIQ